MGEDGVPDHGQEGATVQVYVQVGFHCSPQPEPFSPSSDCGTFQVDAMVSLLNMNCSTVLGVFSFRCLSMSWSLGGGVSGKGCTFWCGWASDTLRSVPLTPPPEDHDGSPEMHEG